MGTISTGTGLISGLDIQGIVEQLMAINRRPVDLLQTQIKKLATEKTSLSSISAQLLSLKLAATPFKLGVTFRPNAATSSNNDVLSAVAASTAVQGTYTFHVRQLAQAHQVASQAFADADTTPIGAGTISIGIGQGNLDRDTDLGGLRNGQGVRRGQIRITDRTGASADIDLSAAVTVSDVLKQINTAAGIQVNARVSGDRIILDDTSGATSHNLVVQDLNGGFAAADLGLAGSVAAAAITGADLVSLTNTTALKTLNDGNGVRTNGYGDDLQVTLRDGTSFSVDLKAAKMESSLSILNNGQGVRAGAIRITNRLGVTKEIDLTGAETVGDVVSAINGADLNVTATLVGGTKFIISDMTTGGDKALKIENVGTGSTATDLGIAGEAATNALSGKDVYRVSTVADVARAIEDAAHRAANPDKFTVGISADGSGLTVTDTTGGTGSLIISSLSGSGTAEDLGLAGTHAASSVTGKRLIAGLNTVLLRSLNGGAGVAAGVIEIQNRAGQVRQVDLSGAHTIQDVIDTINTTAGLGVRAALNERRTGIVLEDLTGSVAANLRIVDVDSTTAHDLKIDIDAASSRVDSGNNQLQYISRSTLLASLNGGNGVSAGSFTITDSTGMSASVNLTADDVAKKTVGDLIDMINTRGLGIQASINATGDGILITDTAGGEGTLAITDTGGRTASDLNLAKTAGTAGAGTIDGSFEYQIEVGGADTLQSVAAKINGLKGPLTAGIINDGSGYRLMVTSKSTGRNGQILFDGGTTGLAMFDLVRPQDAIISLGGTAEGSLVAVSGTNTFKDLVPGLTLTAAAVSSSPVTVTVAQDTKAVVEKINTFVEKFNAVIKAIQEATKYNAETQQAGPLQGNYRVTSVQNQLFNLVLQPVDGVGNVRRFSDLGITIGDGAILNFDESKFTQVMADDPKGIETFFSTLDKGMGYLMDKLTDRLTNGTDGELTQVATGYDQRTKLLNDRIANLNEILKQKEQRLYAQFIAMETALAKIQSMQNALSSLTVLTPITSSSSSKSS